MKTIAIYLPQFHRIPENDEWWGEGFTEWTAVKAAKPLFENHAQPRKPLGGNYYNLLDKSTMMRQADLMKQYGIDGQCVYHYYFKNGRKILEKPMENLLEWKDIDMPFFFSWANGRWARTWSNVNGNSWADVFEKKEMKHGSGILLEQQYGRKEDWTCHFEYLLPFFMDKRYIKLNGAPVFMIHEPSNIYCLEEMMKHWRYLAVQNGFPGIYVIGNIDHRIPGLDAIMFQTPHMFWKLKKDSEKQGVFVFDYEEMWNRILNKMPPSGKYKAYFEGMADCDDTPRRGKNGVVLQNFSVEKFYENLRNLYKKSLSLGNEFLFINAWNEWGEGMYLEPDEKNGYKYLEAVKRAQTDAGQVTNTYEISHDVSYLMDQIETLNTRQEKCRRTRNCLDHWMLLREEKRNLAEYLHQFDIKTVAIYGMGILGKHLLSEFKDSSVKIEYLIDKNHKSGIETYKLIRPDETFLSVDAVIITVIGEFDNICGFLKNKTDAKLLSIEELVYES